MHQHCEFCRDARRHWEHTANLTLGLSTDSLTISNGLNLNVNGSTISNAGTITENSGNNATELVIAGSTTLTGTGTLTMSNNTANFILGGGTFTNQQTIQGAGNVGNNNLTLINSGTIDANVSNVLQINPSGDHNECRNVGSDCGRYSGTKSFNSCEFGRVDSGFGSWFHRRAKQRQYYRGHTHDILRRSYRECERQQPGRADAHQFDDFDRH